MRLLAGLGNPGKEYEGTRHNLGFFTLDKVAKELQVTTWKKFKGGELAEVMFEKEKALLFKPGMFMNKSGVPLQNVVNFYDLAPQNLCIIAEDVYVAPGSARIRKSGGDGGHNGWKSVMEHLDPDSFWRVKIGAGVYEQHPEKRKNMPGLDEYVLQPMPKKEEKLAHQLIDKLVPNLVEWLQHGTSLKDETIHL